MHPIHYSLIMNLAVLAVTGFLAFTFAQPLLVIAAILLANHSLARFDDEDEGGPSMGFLADVK